MRATCVQGSVNCGLQASKDAMSELENGMATIIRVFHRYSGEKGKLKKTELKALINNEMSHFVMVRHERIEAFLMCNRTTAHKVAWRAFYHCLLALTCKTDAVNLAFAEENPPENVPSVTALNVHHINT